ncbi:MAG: hypothetical protein EOO94_03265 [Pedobacter sp.]|nr:MAG: hypothetical protein EOO94_03265 [Pedobacter sp.]
MLQRSNSQQAASCFAGTSGHSAFTPVGEPDPYGNLHLQQYGQTSGNEPADNRLAQNLKLAPRTLSSHCKGKVRFRFGKHTSAIGSTGQRTD